MNLPNKLTVLRMILIVPFVCAMRVEHPAAHIAATALFLLASLTDYLDGHIARTRGIVTDFGKLMDPIADKLLVMAALVGLVAQGRANAVSVMVILGREFVISGVRMVASNKGVVIAAGWMGKLKTVVQMVAIPLLMLPADAWLAGGTSIARFWALVLWTGSALLWVSAAISIWSLVDYILRNKEVIAP